jgi:hypothetical protein
MANKVNLDVSERLDIICRQGDSFDLTLTLKDSSGTALTLATDDYSFVFLVIRASSHYPFDWGDIVGFTNATYPFDWGDVVGPAQPSGKKADSSGIPIFAFTTDDSGNVTVTMAASETRKMEAGRHHWDFQQIQPTASGVSIYTTLLTGSFIVNSEAK